MDRLYKTMEDVRFGRCNIKCEIMRVIPRDNSSFIEVIFECADEGTILMLGYWMGQKEISDGVEKAIPQVLENIEDIIKQSKKPSEN